MSRLFEKEHSLYVRSNYERTKSRACSHGALLFSCFEDCTPCKLHINALTLLPTNLRSQSFHSCVSSTVTLLFQSTHIYRSNNLITSSSKYTKIFDTKHIGRCVQSNNDPKFNSNQR